MLQESLLLLNLKLPVSEAVGLLLEVKLLLERPRHKKVWVLVLDPTQEFLHLLLEGKEGVLLCNCSLDGVLISPDLAKLFVTLILFVLLYQRTDALFY